MANLTYRGLKDYTVSLGMLRGFRMVPGFLMTTLTLTDTRDA